MDPERWQRVQDLFHVALEQPTAQLEEHLATLDEEPEVVDEVRALLAADSQVADRFERAIEGTFALAAEDAEPERRRIGPYRVLGELGRGGLSTVYLGERDDADYRLRVAIKVVKRGMDTREILGRLRQERRILAGLDHPHIARLIDGGSTDDGLPYFVMEHIEGEPIDTYCESRQLDLDARLELFRKVCDAVHYAHRNLVIHRDIKPANILVTDDGTPKLLDFGIAKLLAHDDDPAVPTATAAGLRLLTPEYASPEQVRGEPLTTASDVYSLGVLLFRLLTGAHPYQLDRGRIGDVERVVCEVDPDRPRTVVGQQTAELVSSGGAPSGEDTTRGDLWRWRRRLRGDLDTIVLKALRKEPERRFGTAEQLSADLGRHLAGQPVTSRADTFSYRTGKFLRRHRLAVATAAVVTGSLLIGLVTTIHQARRAERERQRAEILLDESRVQNRRAERVSDFLEELFEISDPSEAKGNRVTAREILDQGAARIAGGLATEPSLQADLLETMGRVYRNLGLYARGQELVEQALENRRSVGEGDAHIATTLALLASMEQLQGHHEAAENTLRRTLVLRRAALPSSDPAVAETLNDLGASAIRRERFDEAGPLLEEALVLRRAALGEDHVEVAETLNNLAVLHYRQKRLAEAEPLFRRSLEIRRQAFGEEHQKVARILNNLAAVVQGLGRLDEAEELQREVVALRRKLLGPDHPELANSLNNLAQLERQRGELAKAQEHYTEALEIFRRSLGDEYPGLAVVTYNLGEVLLEQRRYSEASTVLEDSVARRRQVFGDSHVRLSYPLTLLGRAALEQGDLAAAKTALRQALDLQVGTLGDDDPDLVETRRLLAEASHDKP